MRPLRLICASNDLERARTIEQLLGMEGFHVRITTRRLPSVEDEEEAEEPECGIVLWSHNSVASWPVLELAEEMHARRSLVQVALEPVAPAIASYSGAIDFKGWSGERDSAWSMLRTRIELIEHGGEPNGAPLGAVAALGLASLSILSIAVSDRVDEGPATLQMAEAEPFQAVLAPASLGEIGGPNAPEPEWDLEVALPDTTVPLRTQLPPLPNMETLRGPANVKLARPGLIRSVLNQVVDRIAWFSDDDRAKS